MNSDTIAAIATAMSPSGIGIRKKSVNAKVIQYIMDIFMMRMKL